MPKYLVGLGVAVEDPDLSEEEIAKSREWELVEIEVETELASPEDQDLLELAWRGLAETDWEPPGEGENCKIVMVFVYSRGIVDETAPDWMSLPQEMS